MRHFPKKLAMQTRLACAVGAFALAAGMVPMGGAHAQQASEGLSILMADENGTTVAASADALMARAEAAGEVRIIVGLDTNFAPEGALSATAATSQRAGIAAAQAQMMGALSSPTNVREFETIPYMAMTVSTGDLSSLLSMPGVTSIQEDVPVPPTMSESVPLVEGNKLWNKGHKGAGSVVAVLDTGTRRNHTAFKDSGTSKIVGSACFSSNSNDSTTVCPNGQEKQVNNNNGKAGPNCSNSINGCDHGTHVAAIAAGFQTGNHGLAQKSDILSVQVFSRFDSAGICGSGNAPCVLSFTSDQIAGLEQVLKWKKNGFNVASANMSLGGGQETSHCDSDSRKAIIDNLKSNGVATIIASGNSSFGSSVGAPACISTAVTVGSTTKQDVRSSFSNHDQIVDLFAPGSSILAADAEGPKNALQFLSGTSMATPHVAGAFSLLNAAVPGSTPDEIERALKCTGVQIPANSLPKPRISMLDAYKFLKNPHTQKSFNFTSSNVNNWVDIVGNWFHKNGRLRVKANQTSVFYATVAPFCANDIRVFAEMKYTNVTPNNLAGIMIASTSSSDGKNSGLWFLYSVNASGDTVAEVYQVESLDLLTNIGNAPRLCVDTFTGKAAETKRKLTAEKKGNNITFKIDGSTVCTVTTDARFTDGHAGIVMGGDSNDGVSQLDVFKANLKALNQSSTITTVSSAGQTGIQIGGSSAPLTLGTGVPVN